MKDITLERKGREKEPRQTLALKMFAAIILLAGRMISPSASRSMYPKLPPWLQLHGSKVFFCHCLLCPRSRTTCPGNLSTLYSTEPLVCKQCLGARQSQGSCLGQFVSCLDLQNWRQKQLLENNLSSRPFFALFSPKVNCKWAGGEGKEEEGLVETFPRFVVFWCSLNFWQGAGRL